MSETGNLSATLLYPSRAEPPLSALHGFAASLAVAETLEAYNPARPVTLKWPNDVLIGGAKVSGLLIEREAEALLLGIGINLVSHPEDTPYAATHLIAEMRREDLASEEPLFSGAQAVLAVLSANVVRRFEQLAKQGFAPIRKEWEARAHHLGKTVKVADKSGVFQELGEDGALCLRLADGTQTRIHAGDVSFG